MLKIRDDIDLKELEKFGFDFDDSTGRWLFRERNLYGKTYILINSWNRRILFKQDEETDCVCLHKLYELIQNNFVEIKSTEKRKFLI